MNLKNVFSVASNILLLLLVITISLPLAAQPYAYVTNSPFDAVGTVSVIDTTTNTVVGSPITVGTEPFGIAVTPDGSHVYVANQGFGAIHGSVSVINTSTNAVSTIPLTGFLDPVAYGVAITPDGTRAYVTDYSNNAVYVIATATNTVTDTIMAVEGAFGIAITPDGTRAYVTNGLGTTVSVIATATNTVSATITLESTPGGLAITPDGTHVYVANFSSNMVSVIATATNTVTSTISVGTEPLDVAVTPDGTHVYVTNYAYAAVGTVSVIATATNTVTDTISLANFFLPYGIDITGDGTKAYVVDDGDFAVSVINTATNTLIGSPIAVGTSPAYIAIQKAATPAQMVSNLITVLQGMNITGLGTSLTDQLQQVANDLASNNGLACGDLKALVNHIKAQSGKKVSTSDANQLLAAIAKIETALGCQN